MLSSPLCSVLSSSLEVQLLSGFALFLCRKWFGSRTSPGLLSSSWHILSSPWTRVVEAGGSPVVSLRWNRFWAGFLTLLPYSGLGGSAPWEETPVCFFCSCLYAPCAGWCLPLHSQDPDPQWDAVHLPAIPRLTVTVPWASLTFTASCLPVMSGAEA